LLAIHAYIEVADLALGIEFYLWRAVGDLRKNLWQASIPIPEFRNQAILSSLAATGSVGG
jgi:hypothetical protein